MATGLGNPPPFCGVTTALITPFRDGHMDLPALEKLVDWQIVEGIHGLVVAGSTGESLSLSEAERDNLLHSALQAAGGRVPVIAGTGSSDTATAIRLTQAAEKRGASAALVVTPAYNKPSQEGLYQHFRAIHDASSLPIILYDVPGRTAVQLAVETVARLAELPRVIGIKDANDNLARPLQLRLATRPDFLLLGGENQTALAFLAQGGQGWISVTSNVAPRLCVQLYNAWVALQAGQGGWELLNRLNLALLPLSDALFLESNPAPTKHALSLLGLCRDELRLPLVSVSSKTADTLAKVLANLFDDNQWDEQEGGRRSSKQQ
jgi:4-hydroxy-tetrahydrodipicolinate synthase